MDKIKRFKAFVLLKKGEVVDITQYTTATGMIMHEADQILPCTVSYRIPSAAEILNHAVNRKKGAYDGYLKDVQTYGMGPRRKK